MTRRVALTGCIYADVLAASWFACLLALKMVGFVAFTTELDERVLAMFGGIALAVAAMTYMVREVPLGWDDIPKSMMLSVGIVLCLYGSGAAIALPKPC
jgi:hypothetical protein